jgi:putative Mg2+ transporter-C (MgtC) family protein
MAGTLLDNDPSAAGRVASYVVSGVGFLGAGVIFKDGASVRGLNTATTIWCSAAIGVLGGFGYVHFALIVAIAVLLTNTVLRPLAYRLHPVLPEATPVETRAKPCEIFRFPLLRWRWESSYGHSRGRIWTVAHVFWRI